MIKQIEIDKCYQFLLVTLAFLLPLTVAGANITIGVIGVLWFFSGDYKNKLNSILSNKLAVASIVFFFVHVLGLLWTEDMDWGLHMVRKMWHFLLLLPILLTITKKGYIKYYISAFIAAITISELISYLVWFSILPDPFLKASAYNPTAFMSHISYNPFLAIAIYLILHELLFNRTIKKAAYCFYSFFAFTMIINMFITGGRSGQVMFFIMLILLIFQFFNTNKIKAMVVSIFVVSIVGVSAFNCSEIFQHRVNKLISNVMIYPDGESRESSVGQRIMFAVNSLEIIKKHPLIGVGTGDFPVEYKKVSIKNTPGRILTVQPHNMYLLVLVQLGLVGLISLLSIFYYQIKFAMSSSVEFTKNFGVVLPGLFLVIMLGDSYLLGHFTTTLFVFMSSFLYKTYEES